MSQAPNENWVGLLFTKDMVLVDTGETHGNLPGTVAWTVKPEQAEAILKAFAISNASEAEARRVLQIMADLTITENGQYIPTAAAVMQQMAKNALSGSDATVERG